MKSLLESRSTLSPIAGLTVILNLDVPICKSLTADITIGSPYSSVLYSLTFTKFLSITLQIVPILIIFFLFTTFAKREYVGEPLITIDILRESELIRKKWKIYQKKYEYSKNIEFDEILDCIVKMMEQRDPVIE